MSARQEVRVPGRPELSHAADAVRARGYVFVAGILPVDAAGELVGDGDTVAQARFVLGELERILAASGCSAADVVKVTIFLTDVNDRPLVNPVRREVFGSTRPASTLVEVSGLAVPGAKIEVDAIAAVTT
ncbi:MAG TPA: RidA family protein [Gaiella sp.]|nr:RidA family protein [Gaiella sp.]